MTEMSFQLPLDGYDVLVRIIRGYLGADAVGSPVSLPAVEAATGMTKPHISRNNGFFLSTGILEKQGRGFKLTSDGLHLAQVLDYHHDNTSVPDVQSAWKMVVEKNDFLQRVMTAVKVRGNMDTEAFARHIALTSGAPNKPQYITGARTIITILKAANELIEDEDGTLKVVDDTKLMARDIVLQPPTTVKRQTEPHLSQQVQVSTLGATIPLTVMIQITPATTDDELVEFARKIKHLVQLINTNEMQDDNAEVS